MKMNQWLVTVGAGAALCLGTNNLLAQNNNSNNNNNGRQGRRGPPTPEQIQEFQQRRMDRYKEALEITDDTEWKAIQPLIQKVSDARMAMAAYAGFGRGGMFGRNRGGDNGGGQGGRPSFGGFGASNADVDALQKAIDSKATNSEMKAAIAKFQAARKAKMADLEKAQDDLRKVLTVRQEAIATNEGLL